MKDKNRSPMNWYLNNPSAIHSWPKRHRRLNITSRLGTLTHPAELKKLAEDVVAENHVLYQELFSSPPGFTKIEIRNVVQKNITAEFDHPKIVEAVSDYLYQHFLML